MKTPTVLITIVVLFANTFNVAQAAEKTLFYIHGAGLDRTPVGTYEPFVKDFEKAGFNVVFDLRYDYKLPAARAYVTKVADQVKSLLAKGTAPEDITVSGYSQGAVIAMFASIAIANPKVNFVLLAGCPREGLGYDIDYSKVQGRILSLVDVKDHLFESCKSHLPESALKKEVEFDSGHGHGIFIHNTNQANKLWKEPLEVWAKGQ